MKPWMKPPGCNNLLLQLMRFIATLGNYIL